MENITQEMVERAAKETWEIFKKHGMTTEEVAAFATVLGFFWWSGVIQNPLPPPTPTFFDFGLLLRHRGITPEEMISLGKYIGTYWAYYMQEGHWPLYAIAERIQDSSFDDPWKVFLEEEEGLNFTKWMNGEEKENGDTRTRSEE